MEISRARAALAGAAAGLAVGLAVYWGTASVVFGIAYRASFAEGQVQNLQGSLQTFAELARPSRLADSSVAICGERAVLYSIPSIVAEGACGGLAVFRRELPRVSPPVALVWRPGLAWALALAGACAVAGAIAFASLASAFARAARRRTAIEVDAAIGRVASRVAHDLRSPVAALNVFIAGAGEGAPLSKDSVELGLAACERIARISGDLLDSRRRMSPRTGSVSVADLARSVAWERNAVSAGSVAVEAGEAMPPARAEAGALGRILHNLLANASEASQGPVKLRIARSSNPFSRRPIRVSVEDEGPGFAAEILRRFRAKVPLGSRGKAGGNGIALDSAREAVEGWGGRIELRNGFSGAEVLLKLKSVGI